MYRMVVITNILQTFRVTKSSQENTHKPKKVKLGRTLKSDFCFCVFPSVFNKLRYPVCCLQKNMVRTTGSKKYTCPGIFATLVQFLQAHA